jgi:hypothetical protein
MEKIVPFKCHICQRSLDEFPGGLNRYRKCSKCNMPVCYRHVGNKIDLLFLKDPICNKCRDESNYLTDKKRWINGLMSTGIGFTIVGVIDIILEHNGILERTSIIGKIFVAEGLFIFFLSFILRLFVKG